MGEGFGPWEAGPDAAVMRSITSANIACGFHAGDPDVMQRTVALAQEHGVAIGAHPGYQDLQGFGRRAISLSPQEIYTLMLYQLGALHAFTVAVGARLVHVKPHGALYNHAARDRKAADAIARAVHDFDPQLILVGLANSAMVDAGIAQGLPVAREAFADRVYESDGTLQDRRIAGAVRTDPDAIVAQALMIARERHVISSDGHRIEIDADTICLHGDTHAAADLALTIRTALHDANISVVPLQTVVAARMTTQR